MRREVLVALSALALLVGMAPTAAAGILPDETSQADEGPRAPVQDPGPVHAYHTWETLTVDLQTLVSENPDIARLHSAGESVLGFELWYVEIADFGNENRTPLEEREVVYLDGGIHANEQLGMELAYEWAEFLIDGYGDNETATWIVDNRHTFILPLVNPDGNHKDSRGNVHEVDLNRNFPAGWGEDASRPLGPGSYPLSEPETRAVVDLLDETEPDYVNSFHTGTELMLYPWGYEDRTPADNQTFARICEEIGETDRDFCGPVFSTIYPASGITIDTAYERYGSVAWTYEVADEQDLYTSMEDPRVRLHRYWDGVEHAFLNVEKYGAHPVLDGIAIDGTEVELTVTNEGYGNLTEGELTLEVPGAEDPTVELPALAAGGSGTLTVDVPAEEAEAERLSATLHYVERQQASPTETRTEPLPVEVAGDELEASPLPEDLDTPAGERLDAASVDEAEPDGVPGPGALVAAALLGLAAVARRQR